MKNIDVYSKLAAYGLSRAETSVYIELSRLGSLRINEIVRATDLPRSSVYEYIHELLDKGLVQQQIRESYSHYTALPFSSIKNKLDEKVQILKSLDSELDSVSTLLQTQIQVSSDDIKISYFKGISGARQLLWNTLSAKESVRVYSSWGRSEFVGQTFYKRFVEKSKVIGVEEKVLINGTDQLVRKILARSNDATSRTIPDNIHSIDNEVVNIKGECFIYDNTFAQLYLKDQTITGFEVSGLQFSDMQKSLFDSMWISSKPIC